MQRPTHPSPIRRPPPASPRPRVRAAVSALLLLIALPVPSRAQRTPLVLMPPAEEAALARSAADSDISDHADVWVLYEDGYRLHAAGTNGWTCLVDRDHPESVAPICYDPEGTRTLVPGVVRIERLRAGGLPYQAAVDSVEALYRAGVLPEPTRPVFTTMLSRNQRLHSAPDGPAIGAWRPHVMIFDPGFSNEGMALPEGSSIMVSHLGRIFNYLILPVGSWSDDVEGPSSLEPAVVTAPRTIERLPVRPGSGPCSAP